MPGLPQLQSKTWIRGIPEILKSNIKLLKNYAKPLNKYYTTNFYFSNLAGVCNFTKIKLLHRCFQELCLIFPKRHSILEYLLVASWKILRCSSNWTVGWWVRKSVVNGLMLLGYTRMYKIIIFHMLWLKKPSIKYVR